MPSVDMNVRFPQGRENLRRQGKLEKLEGALGQWEIDRLTNASVNCQLAMDNLRPGKLKSKRIKANRAESQLNEARAKCLTFDDSIGRAQIFDEPWRRT